MSICGTDPTAIVADGRDAAPSNPKLQAQRAFLKERGRPAHPAPTVTKICEYVGLTPQLATRSKLQAPCSLLPAPINHD
jgi:hypothetical protein